MTDIFPFVRIALYALAGYLAGQGADSWVVEYIRTDPDLAAALRALLPELYSTEAWQKMREAHEALKVDAPV